MQSTGKADIIEAETFELKLARDIDGKSIRIFDQPAFPNPEHTRDVVILLSFLGFLSVVAFVVGIVALNTLNYTAAIILFSLTCSILVFMWFSPSILAEPQPPLKPTPVGIDLLVDVHGGLACDICGTPERSLYPPEPSLVAPPLSAKLVEARYKAAKMRGHQGRCNCVRCYNVNKWFTRQEFIAFYNREPAKDNIGYSYRK